MSAWSAALGSSSRFPLKKRLRFTSGAITGETS
jgi:hypothetical protein